MVSTGAPDFWRGVIYGFLAVMAAALLVTIALDGRMRARRDAAGR